MLIAFARQLLSLMIMIFILSIISYAIFMREPLNALFADSNIVADYLFYLGNILKGNLGISYSGGEPLRELIISFVPPTLILCTFAIIFALFIAIPLGLIGAFNSKHLCGRFIYGLSSVGLGLPAFWIAPILLYLSAVNYWDFASIGQYNLLYDIKKITGFPIIDAWFIEAPYRMEIIQNILQHLILPTFVLTILPTMEIIILVQRRAEFLLEQNFVKSAVAKGWSKWRILHTHIACNTLPLLIPHIPRLFTLVIAQCMLTEATLGWPGIGRWLISAVNLQDYNSIAAGIMVIGISIILINLATTILTFLIDPLNKKGWYAR